MKKNSVVKVISIILLFLFVFLQNSIYAKELTISLFIGEKKAIVNFQQVTLDVAPIIRENRTFVPIRFIAETFGAKVSWKEEENNSGEGTIELFFVQENSSILLKMHTQLTLVIIETKSKNQMIPDVTTKQLESTPFIKKPENRTMVPIRFISELLSAKVTWFAETQEIKISKEEFLSPVFALDFSANHPEIEWEKQIHGEYHQFGSFIQQTVDNCFIITGTTTHLNSTKILVIKLSQTGEVLWQNLYYKEMINYGVAIFQTPDNGYILFGNTISDKSKKSHIFILKLNWEGLVLWDKIIEKELDELIYAVKPTKDRGFILCGQTESDLNQSEDAFLTKMDPSGNIEWEKKYSKPGSDLAKDCIQTEDNGYICIGSSLNTNGRLQIYIIKTDSFGNLLWQKTFGKNGNFIGNSVVETQDKGLLMLAETDSFSSNEGIYLQKLDSFGQTLWEKYYEGSKSTIGYSIEKTNSGYFMITGATNVTIDDLLDFSGNADAYFLFVDSYGNKVWDKILTGDQHDLLIKIIRTSDLGFIACGRSSSNENSILSVFLVKLSPIQEEKPLLDVNPLHINFGIVEKNSPKITSFVTISNNGSENLTGYIHSDDSWILLSDKTFIIPTFGSLKVLVSLDPLNMNEGAYDGIINITSNGGLQRLKILCTIVDNSPKIKVNPIIIDFKTISYRKDIAAEFSIFNIGRKNLYGSIYTESLNFKIDPQTFLSNQQKVILTLLASKLKNGNYSETLLIKSNGGNETITVKYIVSFPVINMLLCINSPEVEINGKKIFFDQKNLKIVPFITNGRTMVPLRFISEAFGAEIFWDSFTKKIHLKITEKEIQIQLQVNNSNALINQKPTTLDVPPIIFEQRVYVPIRFIAEAFGATVLLEKNNEHNSCVKIFYEK